MNRKRVTRLSGLMILALGTGAGALAQAHAKAKPSAAGPAVAPMKPAAAEPRAATGPAAAAIDEAAKADKYLFVFFYRDQDQPTQTARQWFEGAVGKYADRAMSMTVDVNSMSDRAIVTRYGLDRAPMPLVLVLAPNGAVTKSFIGDLASADWETAFVSPSAQKCLKALQDRKLVFICIQNGQTQHDTEAMQGVKEFTAAPQYAGTTEVVTLDPADPAERGFLEILKVQPATAEAVTVLMAPPGSIVGTYTGATSKDTFVAATKGAARGCDPRSGCCGGAKKAKTHSKKKP
jgi:hypothetical protein